MENNPTRLSHVDPDGRARMVDLTDKPATARTARARAEVWFPPDAARTLGLLGPECAADLVGPKGPVFQTARLAGIMAAKRTSDLIPLCHPLPLDAVAVDLRVVGDGLVEITATCKTTHKTGVEMEALTAASVAALTVYDMCKALSHAIEIRHLCLVEKTGGKSGHARP